MKTGHVIGAAGLLAVAAVVLAARLNLPLLEPEEGRYAEIPRQMLAAERWLVPTRDGQEYLDKPPLLYWMTMASYRLFGVHIGSARLPVALTTWLTVAVALMWGWRSVAPAFGLFAAAVLMATPDFLYRAPMLTMNGPLALFVAASLMAGHFAKRDASTAWWIASAVSCGLGVLMKGPVAVALIVPPLVLVSRPIRLRSWALWGAVVLAVAGPWHVAIAANVPRFAEEFFWRHHVERFARPFDHAGPVWDYVPQAIIGMFPWSALVPLAAYFAWRERDGDARTASFSNLTAAAGLWGFVFFSLAGSKRPVYLVAIEPMMALAAAAFLWERRRSLTGPMWRRVAPAAALIVAAVVCFALPTYCERFSVSDVVAAIRDDPRRRDLPVYCYGHGWDSVGFLLGRPATTRLGDDRANISADLARQPECLVFVTTKTVGDDFVSRIPDGLSATQVGGNRQVRVFHVMPSQAQARGRKAAG